jgi:hypothetical protein
MQLLLQRFNVKVGDKMYLPEKDRITFGKLGRINEIIKQDNSR